MNFNNIEMFENSQDNKDKKSLAVMITIILIAIIIIFVTRILKIGQVYHYDLGDEITTKIIEKDGKTTEYIDTSIPATAKGDKIIFYIQMPKKLFEETGALCFYQYHSEITVYDGTKVLYQFGQKLTKKQQMYGNELCITEIPEDSWGHELRVEVLQKETQSSNHSTFFRIMKLKDARMYPLVGNALLYVLYLVATIASLFLLVASLLTKIYSGKMDYNGFSMALFTFFLSVWQLGSRRQMYILTNNRHISANIEFFAILIAAVPFFVYLTRIHTKSLFKKIYVICQLAFAVFFWICVLIHGIFHYHIVNFETPFYIMIFTALIVTMIVESLSAKYDKSVESQDIRNGLVFSAVLCAVQIGIMMYRQAFDKSVPKIFLNLDFSTLAALVFIMTLFISIGKSLVNSFVKVFEKEQNKRLAYIDFLTMIPNRLYCSKKLDALDAEEQSNYGIVFFDLDYLKYGNDKYGHKMGDLMLQETATSIKEAFEGCSGIFGRWGGDEFIAIFDEPEDIEAFMKRFEKRIKEINEQKEFPFHFHVSTGFSVKKPEEVLQTNTVVENADQVMYENKKKYKNLR